MALVDKQGHCPSVATPTHHTRQLSWLNEHQLAPRRQRPHEYQHGNRPLAIVPAVPVPSPRSPRLASLASTAAASHAARSLVRSDHQATTAEQRNFCRQINRHADTDRTLKRFAQGSCRLTADRRGHRPPADSGRHRRASLAPGQQAPDARQRPVLQQTCGDQQQRFKHAASQTSDPDADRLPSADCWFATGPGHAAGPLARLVVRGTERTASHWANRKSQNGILPRQVRHFGQTPRPKT